MTLVGALVAILVAASLSRPLVGVTSPPRATLRMAESMSLSMPVPSARARTTDRRVSIDELSRASAGTLSDVFADMDYDLESVAAGDVRVPRLFLASLPADIANIRESKVRKALFFQAVLPLILQVNEDILEARWRLWRLDYRQRTGARLDALDRLWLAVMAERYGVERGDMRGLLRRVDIIPPSLALAQAAAESGWGTSRFVHEGNAIFGQWTFADDGALTPLRRDAGKTHRVRAFASLLDSVRAYARNLNTHRAYRELRQARAAMRDAGKPLDGRRLSSELTRYSERGAAYVSTIRTIIAVNNLRRFDGARLSTSDSSI